MRSRDRSWFGFALSICLTTSLAACGTDLDAPATAQSASAVTGTATSYLVSFPNGTIPSNALSILKGADANAAIKASYTNVGMVLASSSLSTFAAALRADPRVSAVGASRAVSSSLELPSKAGSFQSAADLRKAPPPAKPHVLRAPGSDPLSSRQWDMDQIHSPQARAVNAGKSSVLVATLDSGIDPTHPDLVGQVNMAASTSCVGGVATSDGTVFNDVIGHGTHVAGIIAGKKNNVGIVGVAPGVKVAAIKVAVDDVNDPNFGLVFADAMVCAIDWAVGHGVDVMNASLTIDPFTGPIDDLFCTDEPDRVGIVTIVRQAVTAAAKKDVSLVASTGNMFIDLAHVTSPDGGACAVLPVDLPTVIGVSSVGYTQQLSWFSDYGKGKVDLAGPGGDNLVVDPLVTDTTASGQVLSSVPADSLYYALSADWDGQVVDCSASTDPSACPTYAYLQGTSQAAPHVTGVAALAISRYGKMGPLALDAILRNDANALPCPPSPYDPGMTGQPATCTPGYLPNTTNFYGRGEVDALKVVK